MSKNHNRKSNEQNYDVWSSFYDDYPNPTIAMDERHFPNFWRHHAGKKILEIGCGTGRHTRKLVHSNNVVTAIDASPGMLSIAKQKIQSAKVNFILGDFLAVELNEFNYDVVMESLVLEHIEDLKSFFLKVSSHLKTGGDFYLSEIHPERASRGILAHFKSPTSGEDIHLASYVHNEDTIMSVAKSAGLYLVNQRDILGDQSLVNANDKWQKHLNKPMIKIWHFSKY